MTDQKKQQISTGWREATLGETGIVITGKTPSKENPEDWGNSLDFITPTDFGSESKYLSNVERKLSEEGKKRFQRMIIPSGSVVVTCIGSDMGKVVINKNDCLTNQQINSIIVNPDFDRDFIFYSLKYAYPILRVHADGGSTMPILNKSTFEALSLPFPPFSEQRAIADVLSAFDDKIELLREQNKTLEAIAQTLFNRWFVEFNFPDENGQPYRDSGGKMIDSELGEIPEGWRMDRLGNYIEIRGGSTPSTSNPDFWNGDINWTSPKDLSNSNEVFLLNTEKKVTAEGLNQISSGLLPKHTLLLSSRAPIGYLAIAAIETAINQGYIAFLPNSYLSNHFMYLWLNRNMNIVEGSANGSTFLEISKSSFRDIEGVIPKEETLKVFDSIIKPIFAKILFNLCQIQTLSSLRDMLLPKLMKGVLRVKGF